MRAFIQDRVEEYGNKGLVNRSVNNKEEKSRIHKHAVETRGHKLNFSEVEFLGTETWQIDDKV